MDVYGQIQTCCQFELCMKSLLLLLFESNVPVIVQAYFAYGHGMLGKPVVEFRKLILPVFLHVFGMQPQHGIEHSGMPLACGEHRRTLFAAHICQQHLTHSGRYSPFHHGLFFAAEGIVSHVGMRVDEHTHKYSDFPGLLAK